MRIRGENIWGPTYHDIGHGIKKRKNGFLLSQSCSPDTPQDKGDFSISTKEEAVVDYRWFRGGWYDARTRIWKDIENLELPADSSCEGSTGASLYVPFRLEKGESKTVHLLFSWFVPHSDLTAGTNISQLPPPACDPTTGCCSSEYTSQFYEPWYSGEYEDIRQMSEYWEGNYLEIREKTAQFTRTLFASQLPPEVMEAVTRISVQPFQFSR